MSDAQPWRLQYASSARKDLRRLDPQVRRRVLGALDRLAQAEGTKELRKLRGGAGSRLRVGDWRVIVELEPPTRSIRVKRVLPRGRAYR